MVRVFLRVDFDDAESLGPGKIGLLEKIRDEGSISAGARAMRMSYRRAWLLVESLNLAFGGAVVDASTGGKKGGGATLTALGAEIVRRYRAAEQAAMRAAQADLTALSRAIAPGRKPPRKRRT
jgi:molybdate transport system regulatory protein